MKEIISLAASHLTAFTDDRPVPLTEIVLVTAEPEYLLDPQGEVAKQRTLSQTRFTATTAELREIASTLSLWADERDMMSFTPAPPAIATPSPA